MLLRRLTNILSMLKNEETILKAHHHPPNQLKRRGCSSQSSPSQAKAELFCSTGFLHLNILHKGTNCHIHPAQLISSLKNEKNLGKDLNPSFSFYAALNVSGYLFVQKSEVQNKSESERWFLLGMGPTLNHVGTRIILGKQWGKRGDSSYFSSQFYRKTEQKPSRPDGTPVYWI